MKFYELIIEDEGVERISLVEEPAIEANFLALKDEEPVKMEFKAIDSERRILLGPALIPNKPIFRVDENTGEEYYVFFSQETIRRTAELYMVKARQSEANLEHATPIEGTTVIESWIVEDTEKDKSALYGMPQKVGTWMVAMKVYNDEVWQDQVKEGKVKGFSIEGWFKPKPTQMQLSKEQPNEKLKQAAENYKDEQLIQTIIGVVKSGLQ